METRQLNKFQQTRLFSARALELANGAKPKFDLEEHGMEAKLDRDFIKVAKKEYELGLIDLELFN